MNEAPIRMGSGDCERIREGWLAQPFNALTSLAFVVAGATTMRRGRTRSPDAVGLALAAAATGVASFLWHGPQPRTAQRLHDGSVTWLLAQVLLFRNQRSRRCTLCAYLQASATALGALYVTRAQRTNAVIGGAVAAVAAKEVRAPRRGQRRTGHGTRSYGRALAALIAGAAALALGRTGSPLCDPDRFVQLHGLWHVAAAVALDGYVLAMDS